MKTMSVAEAEADMAALIKASQKERVILTQSGRPSAVLVGIEGYDEEDIRLASSAEFWSMIEGRQKGKMITLAELQERLKKRKQQPAKKPRKAAGQ